MYAPPRKERSPWVGVGIGCGVVAVGLIIFGIFLCVQFVNSSKRFGMEFQKSVRTPIIKRQIAKEFGDVPLYPFSKVIDDENARMGRASIRLNQFLGTCESAEMATVTTPDQSEAVLSWYTKQLDKIGFIVLNTQKTSTEISLSSTVTFQRNRDFLTLQVIQAITPIPRKTTITLLLFRHLKDGQQPPTMVLSRPTKPHNP